MTGQTIANGIKKQLNGGSPLDWIVKMVFAAFMGYGFYTLGAIQKDIGEKPTKQDYQEILKRMEDMRLDMSRMEGFLLAMPRRIDDHETRLRTLEQR